MTDLNYEVKNNLGGNYLVRFVPVGGVVNLPTPALSTVQGQPTFRDGFRWFYIYGTDGTKNYEEEEAASDNGPIWSITVTLFLPSDSIQLRQQLAEMATHRFLLEVEDNNGLTRRVGSLTQTLELKAKFGTSDTVSGRRGTNITFSGQFSGTAPLLIKA